MTQPSPIRLLHVVGARPNFVKVAPVMRAVEAWNASADAAGVTFQQSLVHTGQHYDDALSGVFFDQLGLPKPDKNLGVGSGSQAEQTALLLQTLEPVMERHRPDLVIVPGDVNSTLAGALVAAKLGIPLGHLEAGLRSGDRAMPEEINRIVADHLADVLFTTCVGAGENLLREGMSAESIKFVGNTMIDTLERMRPGAEIAGGLARQALGLPDEALVLATLHRPTNVDDPAQLRRLLDVLVACSRDMPVVFPVHLRTRRRLADLRGWPQTSHSAARLILCEPLAYLDFLGLMMQASAVVTDSGGIQEETTVLGVPCVTVRTSTERPITLTEGTNVLVDPADAGAVLAAIRAAVSRGVASPPPRIELWDGGAGTRVVQAIVDWVLGPGARS